MNFSQSNILSNWSAKFAVAFSLEELFNRRSRSGKAGIDGDIQIVRNRHRLAPIIAAFFAAVCIASSRRAARVRSFLLSTATFSAILPINFVASLLERITLRLNTDSDAQIFRQSQIILLRAKRVLLSIITILPLLTSADLFLKRILFPILEGPCMEDTLNGRIQIFRPLVLLKLQKFFSLFTGRLDRLYSLVQYLATIALLGKIMRILY